MNRLTFAACHAWAYFRALYARDYDMYSHLDGDDPVPFSDHQIQVMRSQIIDARNAERGRLLDQRARRAAAAMKAEAVYRCVNPAARALGDWYPLQICATCSTEANEWPCATARALGVTE